MMLRKLLFSSIGRSHINTRRLKVDDINIDPELSLNAYQEASDNALDELSENLEFMLEDRYDKGADVSLNNGVLTVKVDDENTYVINKQTPNKQIWLSSPISGPKRFDYVAGRWIEKHSKAELSNLISSELSELLKK